MLPLMSVTEISQDALITAMADGLTVVDVREPDEYAAGHVAGARNIPLGTVETGASELDATEPVIVICQAGGRSMKAAEIMGRAGMDARSVVGGTGEWIAQGRPVVTGPSAG